MKKVKDLKKWVEGYEAVNKAVEELALAFDFFKEGVASEADVDSAYATASKLL